MASRRTEFSGRVASWICGGALAIQLLALAGMVALLAANGLGYFWPRAIWELSLADGTRMLGEIHEREAIPAEPGHFRLRLRTANRDLSGADFTWVDEAAITGREVPEDAVLVERREWGHRIGRARATEPNGALVVTTSDGAESVVAAADVVREVRPNALGPGGKLALYASRLWEFVSAEPRESNTEGGIFPAIFGTVLMVLLMTFFATPFGVLAAVWLREYARQGVLVRLVRIAVNNLAGVPSIVFGVFGLGFFVYGIGGTVDHLLFADALPTPTFGTGGILWASLTLALLTVPVVIVASEEGLAAVPRSLREGSLALGATRFETVWRVVVPAATPGILTGVILAMSRAAGEVAPLMVVGMVKLAPALPIDATVPFVHLERKFMHLGFHIYDVGFQSPNVEATTPLVFATAFLLVLVVIAMNSAAIALRGRLRRRYRTSAV